MAASNIIPWGLHELKPWIKTELEKRSNEVGMNPDPTNYAGPRTAWMRFFSNGISPRDAVNIDGKLVTNHEGFIMGGVQGFNDSYGFNKDGRIILGYDAEGEPHSVPANMDSSFPHQPPPAVDSIVVTLYGGQNSSFSGLCRKARVNWKCNSLDQLNYLEPYFLKPKVTAVVEWGWNNYQQGTIPLMDLEDKDKLKKTLLDGGDIMKRIEDSKGNYDAMMGFIFDYGFSLNALGGYDCFTEFVNANWLIEGQEYKSTSVVYVTKDKETGKTTETPMKTFVEFVDTDINNFSIQSNRNGVNLQLGYFGDVKGKTFVAKPDDSTNPNAIGHTRRKIWLRMDLVQDIFNKYFSLVFKDADGNPIGNGSVLDISESILCGNPAIKSVIEDVLIPNKFAPRFTTVQSELLDRPDNKQSQQTTTFSATPYGIGTTNRTTTPATQTGPTTLTMLNTDSEYSKLFPEMLETIKLKNLTQEYDNLQQVINRSGRSFPMFEHGDPNKEQTKNALPGTWGYLSDIFISTEMIKEAMAHNDSAYRVLEYLLNRINEAFCGVVQLKIVPHSMNSKLSVIDTNYNPNAYVDPASRLPRFTPGAVNSAFMTKAGLDVKISQEMASQMVAESSDGRKVGGVELRVGVKQANRFVGNDRLYDVGTLNKTEPSNSSPESKVPVSDRDFSPNSGRFTFYQNKEENNKKYLIIEKDKMFMQSILSKDATGKMIYINSPILPGTKFTMETLGIGGFTFLGQFTLDHVPSSYAYKKSVWQIADIKQTIANGNWTTEITADCRPLSYIRR
jgi:hypothetical protein